MTVAPAVAVMTTAEAERITNRITLLAGTIREGVEKLGALVAEAKAGNAHVALGYASWTAYLADTLGQTPLRLDAPERREVVALLTAEGMSTRAIAPIVGASHMSEARDLAGVTDVTPAPAVVDRETGEITEPAPVTGLDGKTYTRPAPTPAPRVPTPRANIPATVTAALVSIDTARRSLEAVTSAQLRAQSEEARSRWAANLSEHIDALAGVVARLTKETN